MDNTVSKEPTVNSLDELLVEINSRVITISSRLHDGLYGETPKGDTDSCEKESIPSPSLASLNQRIGYINNALTEIERYCSSIHS